MNGSRSTLTCLALATVVTGPFVGGAACRRGDGSSAALTKQGATTLWSIELGAAATPSALAVAPDGTIYVAGYDRPQSPPAGYASAEGFHQVCLYAVDAQGQVARRLAGTVARERPEVWVAVAPWGAAYAVDALGGIYGLLPGGRERYNMAQVRVAGPLAIGHRGQLYVGGQGGVTALALETEEAASLFLSTGSAYASAPVVGPDGTLFFTASGGGRLLAASPQGEILWARKALVSRPVASPDGTLYLPGTTTLWAFAATSGEPIWEFEAETALGTAPAVAPDGSVYVATQSGLLYSLANGRKRWSFALERPVRSDLTVDGLGTVYAADNQGKVYGVGADGLRRWALQLPAATGTPVAGPDGTVYVADSSGKLHALAPPGGD